MLVLGYLGVFLGKLIKSRHQPAARVPGRRLRRAVHPLPGRNRRGAEEDRRPEPTARGFATATPRKSATCSSATPSPAASSIFSPRTRRWMSAFGRWSPTSTAVSPQVEPVAIVGEAVEAESVGGPAVALAHRRLLPPSPLHSHGSGRRKDRAAHRPAADGAPGSCRPDGGPVAAAAVGGRPRTVGRPGAHLRAAAESRRRGHPGPATATAGSADRRRRCTSRRSNWPPPCNRYPRRRRCRW